MKILITGASGFIGTHLATYCLDQGHEVHMIDNNWQNDHPLGGHITHLKHNTYDIDVADRLHYEYGGLDALFDKIKPDVCYHLASYASEGRSNHIRSFIHYNNTVGTANMINACVNHKCKLVFTSSVAVYSGSPPFTEAMRPNPIDEYGLSKYMSECSIEIAGETQDLDWCIIRPRNVYGPGQNMWDRSRNLFGIWMYNALHDLPCLIYGDGLQGRSFTYIDDIIPCLYRAKDVSHEVINLGSAFPWTVEAAAVAFKEITGYSKFSNTEPRHEVLEAFCNTSKSKKLLGFADLETNLIDGLAIMWDWAKKQPERPLQQMPELEVQVNAHSSLK